MRLMKAKSGWGLILGALLFLSGSIVFGYTIEEIRELQRLGFSPQQIVDLQRQGGPAPAAADPGSLPGAGAIPVADGLAVRMQELRERGNGLLIVCFSKEWIARGPGFLHIARREANGKWVHMGRAGMLDCSHHGGFGPPRVEEIRRVVKHHGRDRKSDRKGDRDGKDGKKDGHAGKPETEEVHVETIYHPRPLVTTRYYAEFELPRGQYELKAERLFFTGENEDSGLIKIRRHRSTPAVPITAGRATILSYCWADNGSFGLVRPFPPHHQDWVEDVASRFRSLPEEVR